MSLLLSSCVDKIPDDTIVPTNCRISSARDAWIVLRDSTSTAAVRVATFCPQTLGSARLARGSAQVDFIFKDSAWEAALRTQ